MYAASLDSISMTLKTRDSKTVNMGIVVASVINGFIWMLYAILVSDIYVLTPNLAALCSAFLQLNLYKWTKG
jgi:solute carrier family 50 protein (sugar transporter)